MSFSIETEGPVKCKVFISEAEIEERKQKRQEEWEKVRKPEDPMEAPEEEYDPRSLFERLQEQKDKQQAEYEESHRLKNLVKGLDDDEVAFLELVDKAKVEMETKLWNEEMKEVQEFKKAVATLSEEASEARLNELRNTLRLQMKNCTKKSQQALLSSAIKRKTSNGTATPEKKQRLSSELDNSVQDDGYSNKQTIKNDTEISPSPEKIGTGNRIGALTCIGVLPGLGAYTDSSDSDNSSLSDTEKDSEYDLIGKILPDGYGKDMQKIEKVCRRLNVPQKLLKSALKQAQRPVK